MSKKTHSQDSNSEPKIAPLGGCYNYSKLKEEGLVDDFEAIWKEMDEIEPLTPIQSQKAYRDAATFDHMIFGDYDGYEAYKADDRA